MSGKMRGVMIGAGNVACSLAPALTESVDFVQVYAPTRAHAAELADRVGAIPVSELSEIIADADFYLLAVADHAMEEVVGKLPRVPDAVWAHTSGGIDKSVLASLGENCGVFYPLQTFSRGKSVDMSVVPFFIEGNTGKAEEILTCLARSISDNVRHADGRTRCALHVAGVLTCNFVNNMWDTADRFLREYGCDFSVVRPLIEETLRKTEVMPIHDAQTGPARRGDYEVMRRHMAMLGEADAEMYRLMSQRILKEYGHESDKL